MKSQWLRSTSANAQSDSCTADQRLRARRGRPYKGRVQDQGGCPRRCRGPEAPLSHASDQGVRRRGQAQRRHRAGDLTRIAAHDADEAKEFFTRAVLIVSKDKNLTKAHERVLASVDDSKSLRFTADTACDSPSSPVGVVHIGHVTG